MPLVSRRGIDASLMKHLPHAAGGHSAEHEARVGENHHVICRSCGASAAVAGVTGNTGCLTSPGASGYEIDEIEVIY